MNENVEYCSAAVVINVGSKHLKPYTTEPKQHQQSSIR